MCIAVAITAQEAMQLWVRSGRKAYTLAAYFEAARKVGITLHFAQQGDALIMETEVR